MQGNAFISSRADTVGGGGGTGLDQAQVDARIRALTSTVARELPVIQTDAPTIHTDKSSISTNYIGRVIPEADRATEQYHLGTPDALVSGGEVTVDGDTFDVVIPAYRV